MTQWNTSAIVLSSRPWGESDLRVEFMTPGQGRIVAVAKGALRSRKRFSGMFDIAQLVDVGFMIGPRSGRVMVEHASLQEPFWRFRKHPLRLARASLLIELVTLTAAEHEPSPGAFDSLKQGLMRLHQDPDQDRWAFSYAYRILAGAGYRPGLEECVGCLCPPDNKSAVFSADSGGILCPACSEKETRHGPLPDSYIEISPDTVNTLSAIMNCDEKLLSRILFTKNALAQARQILVAFIAYHLGRPSRVLEFMENFK